MNRLERLCGRASCSHRAEYLVKGPTGATAYVCASCLELIRLLSRLLNRPVTYRLLRES